MAAQLTRLRESPLGDAARGLWRSRPVRRLRYTMAHEPRNAELRNRHDGRRCFVIGNGPSILGHDLTLLRNEIVFCLNSFFYHPQLRQIAPDYLCSQDPDLHCPEHRRAWHDMHVKHGTQGITMLFNVGARRIDRRLGLFTEHTVYYLHAGSELIPPMWERESIPVDLIRPLATYGIVLTDIALPAALYMGCKEIVLLGFDGGEVQSFDDYVNYNFYGRDPMYAIETYRAWYDQFFGPHSTHDDTRVGLWERSFPAIRRTLEEHGAEIVNATPVGQTFSEIPRASFEAFVEVPSTPPDRQG